MSKLRTLVGLTVVTHVALAWLVRLDAKKLDAKKRGDDASDWVVRTLVLGVFGAADYVRNGR